MDARTVKRPGSLAALETIAWFQLSHRAIWLILLLALANMAIVSIAQVQYQRFDTLKLMSILGLITELAMLFSVFTIFLSTPSTRQRWLGHFPSSRFSYVLNGISLGLIGCLLMIVLLAPVMYFHRYPELVESGIRIPLMMLQREILVLLAILVSANVMQICSYVLKLRFTLAALLGIAAHVAIGYFIAYLSYTNDAFVRLNDVFFYNQLGERFDWFPDLLTGQVFHNMEFSYFTHYLLYAFIVWLVTLVLWIPAAVRYREQP